VLATARKLVAEAKDLRQDVLYSPNGVDYNHFVNQGSGSAGSVPEDLKPILALNQPIIGYYGALARWFDYNLLKSIAAFRPNYSFVIIGPDYDGTLEPERLSDYDNIHWLGVKPYNDLPNYLHYFDVATIPFIVNEITHATSPLKLFEYMAGGKPVVITPMQESMGYPGVLVGENAEKFVEQLDRALELSTDSEYIESLKLIARKNTWDSRAKEIIQKISDLPITT
jgi:glycosyltransferase involved in cell wall biosynthesis